MYTHVYICIVIYVYICIVIHAYKHIRYTYKQHHRDDMPLPQEETAGDLENERTRVQWDSHALSDDEHDDMGEECVQATTLCSHGVRIATIDNFQGEENQIIIVSLVRSNPKHIPGFLKVQNRVNVLLSRAKHAQYIIGNRETVRSSS